MSRNSYPKMERCNARSMELFRRIGLSKKIRDAGLRADCSMDVFIVEDLTKPPLLEEKHPSIEEFQKKIRDCNDLAMALEPYQLISQYTLEPLLKTEAESLKCVDVRSGLRVCRIRTKRWRTQSLSAAWVQTVSGKFCADSTVLVGCDGGSSPIRKQLGIKLRGEGRILELQQALFYCEELFDRLLKETAQGWAGITTGQTPSILF